VEPNTRILLGSALLYPTYQYGDYLILIPNLDRQIVSGISDRLIYPLVAPASFAVFAVVRGPESDRARVLVDSPIPRPDSAVDAGPRILRRDAG
jgi:hypothetical protein